MELKMKRACVHCGRKFGLRGVKTHERTCVGALKYDMREVPFDEDGEVPMGEPVSEVEQLAYDLKEAHDAYETASANMENYIERLRARY